MIADWLSMRSIVGVLMGKPSLPSSHLSQMSSFVACAPAIYLASVLDSVMEDCFFELQLMAPPASKKTKPDIDFQSDVSFAQLASA